MKLGILAITCVCQAMGMLFSLENYTDPEQLLSVAQSTFVANTANSLPSLNIAATLVTGNGVFNSASMALGLILAISILAFFIAMALRLRHAFTTTGFGFTSVFLLYAIASQPQTWLEVSPVVVFSVLLLTFFAAETTLSVRFFGAKTSPGVRFIRAYELILAVFMVGTLLQLSTHPVAYRTVYVICAAGLFMLGFYSLWMSLSGRKYAIYLCLSWVLLGTMFATAVVIANHGPGPWFYWQLAVANMLLAVAFTHRSLRSRMRWLKKLENSEQTDWLLSIERSQRDFSREVEMFLSNIEPDDYEEAILNSFLSHLDNIISVSASAVAISHRGTVRMVTRFADGDAQNFAAVLQTRELLLQSVCLSEQAAVIHSDELGAATDATNLSALCIVPVPIERNDWAGVVLARAEESDFSRDELRLVKDFADLARDAMTNAENFGKVRRQAETDSLTDLLNRGAIMGRAERAFKKARSLQVPLSFLFIDIDNFKEINDTYGHDSGDRALTQIAAICHSCLRGDDMVGRYGGEEFIAILQDADAANAETVAERIRNCVETWPFDIDGQEVTVTVSIGISEIADRFVDVGGMVRAADRALYCAKREGRNRVVHHRYMLRGDKVKIGYR